jgi:hypothetical protein
MSRVQVTGTCLYRPAFSLLITKTFPFQSLGRTTFPASSPSLEKIGDSMRR